jgi:SET domain-containing protein
MPIRRGTWLLEYTGPLLTNAEAQEKEDRGARYLFEINSRWTIDGTSRWNRARYVNHSCRPNAEAVGRGRGIVYVARKRIKPDEEITVDYGKNYFDAYIGKSKCRCPKCHERRNERRSELRAKHRRRRKTLRKRRR